MIPIKCHKLPFLQAEMGDLGTGAWIQQQLANVHAILIGTMEQGCPTIPGRVEASEASQEVWKSKGSFFAVRMKESELSSLLDGMVNLRLPK